MRTYLSFETTVADVEARLDEMRTVAEKSDSPALAEEISKLEARAEKALTDLYASLTPWQKTMVARAQGRPRFGDYIKGLVTEFTPLAGDRYFGEDEAIVGGLGRFEGESVCVIGQEKGDDTASRVRHNFGMARPEGYRKATRLMQLADRFGLPVISLIDTAGAFPGIEAEERGQAEAIARSIDTCLSIGVPNVGLVIGEGGSGGALAIAACNSCADARTRDLHGGFARSRRLDPLARFLARAGGGDRHEDHRPGLDQVRPHRRHRSRAARRRAPQSGRNNRLRRARAQGCAQVAAQSRSRRTSQCASGEIFGDGTEDIICQSPARLSFPRKRESRARQSLAGCRFSRA